MQPLLLLHGAIGAADQLAPLASELGNTYRVYTLDFSGHGAKAFPEGDFSIALFAEDVLAFMKAEGLEKVSIFGYSMGGYVAMYLAKHHPEKFDKIVTLATKFHWTEEIAAKETGMLDAERIAAKVPDFAEALANRHAGKDWKEVLARTAVMLRALGADNTLKPEDYRDIHAQSLILLGDRDKMVGLEETRNVSNALPNAAMMLLDDTPHPIEQVGMGFLAFLIRSFLK